MNKAIAPPDSCTRWTRFYMRAIKYGQCLMYGKRQLSYQPFGTSLTNIKASNFIFVTGSTLQYGHRWATGLAP